MVETMQFLHIPKIKRVYIKKDQLVTTEKQPASILYMSNNLKCLKIEGCKLDDAINDKLH